LTTGSKSFGEEDKMAMFNGKNHNLFGFLLKFSMTMKLYCGLDTLFYLFWCNELLDQI